MLTTVEGLYENGRVELVEQPPGVERAKVYVTFVVDGPEGLKSAPTDEVEPWLAFLREGLALGGPPYPNRDELYEDFTHDRVVDGVRFVDPFHSS